MSVSTAKDTRNSTMISCGGDPLLNIKEHSGKRSCKKQINKNLFFFVIRVVFKGPPPLPQIGLWTFEPAFSPQVSFPLSPRSIFSTGQRFPISNHVTSGSHEPAILFSQWSAVSHTGNDMTSSICSRPIRSQHYRPNGPNVLLPLSSFLIG